MAMEAGKKEILDALGIKGAGGKKTNMIEQGLKILDHRSVQRPLNRLFDRFLPEVPPQKSAAAPAGREPLPGIAITPEEAAQHRGKAAGKPWYGQPRKVAPAEAVPPAPPAQEPIEGESEGDDVIDSLLLFLSLQPPEMPLGEYILWVNDNRKSLVDKINKGKRIAKRLGEK